jgi:hypothetical protein
MGKYRGVMKPIVTPSSLLPEHWGKLRLDPNKLPNRVITTTRLNLLCECGREAIVPFHKLCSGVTISCGRCNYKSKEYWLAQTWGKLKLDPNQDLPDEFGFMKKRVKASCSCGHHIERTLSNIVRGKSCGHCDDKSKDYWLSQTWGKLKLDPNQDLPDEWSMGSHGKFNFKCECGGYTKRPFNAVRGGKFFHSCGHCNNKPKEYWLAQTWGKLKLDPNQELPSYFGRELKLRVICDCGKTANPILRAIVRGNTRSCGHCNDKPKDYWLAQKWGKLRLDPNQDLPDEWGMVHNRLQFICDCGRRKVGSFKSVITYSVTCTQCRYKSKSYWLSKKWGKLKLGPNQDLPDEWGVGSGKVAVICDCGSAHTTDMSNLIYGYTKSCGCTKQGGFPDSPARLVYNYIKSLSPTSEFSYWWKTRGNKRREYDIYVPSKKLAVEYHGLYWHSEEEKGKLDYDKYLQANHRGDRLIQIYEDEWRDKQEIMKEMLTSLLTPPKGKRIKPTFSLEYTTSKEARTFLDAHHYLGAASGCLTVMARYGEAIVGVWVFMKRETGVILWHRACVDHKFKMWNPHEKVLSLALPVLKEMGFKKMVTFSDNRFHTGELYTKLGFKFEKELKPDYGYTDYSTRRNKVKFRVSAGVSELETAQAKGWHRIWDSGKKRFSLSL